MALAPAPVLTLILIPIRIINKANNFQVYLFKYCALLHELYQLNHGNPGSHFSQLGMSLSAPFKTVRGALNSLSSSFSSQSTNEFMKELALRSRTNNRSDRRIFRDMPDGLALLLMTTQFVLWLGLIVFSLASSWSHQMFKNELLLLLWQGPAAFAVASLITLLSCVVLYHLTALTLHTYSIGVLIFVFVSALSGVPISFGVGNVAGIVTFLFLALYYWRGWAHSKLSQMFIKSATRICWRNLVRLTVVYLAYFLVLLAYLLVWCAGIWSLQRAPWSTAFKIVAVTCCMISFMLTGAFMRDFLQIWLSRVIYLNTFRHGGDRATFVTSITRRPSTMLSSNCLQEDSDDDLEQIRRKVTRESMWWCLGTACRSAFHLVLRGVSVHLWVFALIQVCFPRFGPPANPTCVLDVFHVPTAIYGTSFTKSRKFVGETMLNHGMDKISVDVFIRTFIYYMFTYANGMIALLILQWPLNFKFRSDFVFASMFSMYSGAGMGHFAVVFAAVSAILIVTSIDSVYMILCWAICETPTSVSYLEAELMTTLVSQYHARLDLKRFSGDCIEINNELTVCK